MLDIAKEHLKLIHEVLGRFPALKAVGIVAFGSRVNGKAKKFSDLDLCLKLHEESDENLLNDLRCAFSDSDLPFYVDLVNYNTCSDSFKSIIDRESISFL
ncbi:MAG: nucleotidyltransferase domain-containing protein [Puniceicoccales bacterium]|jgi:predicted nucleotidyltransferase|nr:nucleotidyltransferase domain-containing protein [Puniceicoccales bacterium]